MELKYIFFALIIAIPMAYADSGNTSNQMMNSALAQVTCKMNFEIGLVNLMTANSQNPELQNLSTKLQDDEQQLQFYANNADSNDFGIYVQKTSDPDILTINDAIVHWRMSYGMILNNGTSAPGEEQLRSNFETCSFTSLQQYSTNEIQSYNNVLDDAHTQVVALNAKGVNTIALTSLIASAQSTIVNPLQSAVDSANDSQGLTAAVSQYCLTSGCDNGTNFHFYANWDIAKLSAIESLLQTRAAGNFPAQFSQVTGNLTQSQYELNVVGNSSYQLNQTELVFDPLYHASNTLQQILNEVGS